MSLAQSDSVTLQCVTILIFLASLTSIFTWYSRSNLCASSSAENDAFEKIKVQITTAPVLAFYDPAKELTLENDESEYGLGSAL